MRSNPTRSAFIIIDMENGFISPESALERVFRHGAGSDTAQTGRAHGDIGRYDHA